ncbi:MAG: hypothetical protein RSC33_03860 [Vagococcus sp.]
MKKHLSDLEVTFSSANRENLVGYMSLLFASGILGIILGIFIPTKVAGLFFISFLRGISAIFSIRLSKKMK